MEAIKTKKQIKTTKNLNQYAGLWVAFIDEKIISSANTLKELEEKTQKIQSLNKKNLIKDWSFSKRKKMPIYFLVPRQDEGPYILFS